MPTPTEKRTAQTWRPPTIIDKEFTVEGTNRFKINATSFVISPLSADANLHVVSIHAGIENDKILTQINSGQYTQINGLVPNIELYIDTEDTFYVKF